MIDDRQQRKMTVVGCPMTENTNNKNAKSLRLVALKIKSVVINRHNYEKFFLLYVDNELNESDRSAVEQFLLQNPDLAEEMEMLKQAVLPGENIAFEQKEILYNKAEGISLNNYEEYFLLSVDKELTQQENEEVERFVLKHPVLQNEFTLLEQTRLEPENIVFARKDELYKKEGKERPVILLNWMRMSVAAAIIGLAVMTWFFSQNNSNKHTNSFVSTSNKPVKRLPQTIQQIKPVIQLIDKNLAAVQEKMPRKAEKVGTTKVNLVKVGKGVERKDVFAVNAVKNKPAQTFGLTVKDEKVAEIPVQDKKAFEEAIASAKIVNNSSSNIIKNDARDEKFINKTLVEQNPPLVKQVVYREINTEEDDEEKSLYIGSAQINKNKLKGLFKKATSFLGARNNNNDGEKTLKIAGFEIKSK